MFVAVLYRFAEGKKGGGGGGAVFFFMSSTFCRVIMIETICVEYVHSAVACSQCFPQQQQQQNKSTKNVGGGGGGEARWIFIFISAQFVISCC